MDKVTRQCPQTTTFLKRLKGEPPKRYRTEVLPLTSLNALPLGQTGSQYREAKRDAHATSTVTRNGWPELYIHRDHKDYGGKPRLSGTAATGSVFVEAMYNIQLPVETLSACSLMRSLHSL